MSKLSIGLLGGGLLLAAGSLIFGWFIFPAIIKSKISQQIRLVEGGDTWKKWENIPIPIYMKIYIYNVTNAEEVQSGAKPILNELGPYVYQQKREKTDITVNEEHDSVSYRQKVYYHFRPDMTVGSLDDVITVVNLPFIGITAKALKEGAAARYVVQEMFQEEFPDVGPFTTLTVDEFLFKGQYIPYIRSLSDLKGEVLMPNYTFGLYYNKNGSDPGMMEVFSGVKDSGKFGNIASWKNESTLNFWNDEYCNMINGSDGALFPPFVTRDRVLPIFSPDLCRSLRLSYDADVEIQGLNGYTFALPDEILENPKINKANQCFCTNRGGDDFQNCPKKGAYQLESCRKGIPLVVSQPHFLGADDEMMDAIIGLQPAEKEKHTTVIALEPNTGVLLRANKRIQINIELRQSKKFKPLKRVPDMVFPIFWMDESAELSEESAARIKTKLIKPQKTVGTAMWIIFAIGCVLIVAGVLNIVRQSRNRQAQHKVVS